MATIGWTTDTEADAYIAASINSSSWSSLSSSDKTKYLTTAYRLLYNHPEYEWPATPSQSMEDAQAEMALFLLNSGGDSRSSLRAAGVNSFSIGNFSESLKSVGETSWSGVSVPMPALVLSLIYQYQKAPDLQVFIERPIDGTL